MELNPMIEKLSSQDKAFLELAYEEALKGRDEGNLPIGCVAVLNGKIVGKGHNRLVKPVYNPWRHAECEALRTIDESLLAQTREMTLYTTLEPCIMCMSTAILHGIGRVVFGAIDQRGGATCVLDHLPAYYAHGGKPIWDGPINDPKFDELYQEVALRFQELPCSVPQE
jgi:tRNA(Arg) A34 adenosine deaminase TadA